ncbi:MAG: tail protein X [Oscillibacter sp.]
MERTYTTQQGDAWDAIAYRVYGDVKYTGWLMQNNYPQLDTFVFGQGVILQTPEPPENITKTGLPIWRAEA